MTRTRFRTRIFGRRIIWLLATLVVIGCDDGASARKASLPKTNNDSDASLHSKSDSTHTDSDKKRAILPTQILIGEWDFDPDALRKTSEYQQQIELLESRGYAHDDAVKRGESSFRLMSSIKYIFTENNITIRTQNGVISQEYRVKSRATDTLVIQPEKSDAIGKHTTIRIIDPDHIVVSDDSRPDVPVWTFKRSSE